MGQYHYQALLKSIAEGKKSLAILIDPDKFDNSETVSFLKKIPAETTHLFVGGSKVLNGHCEATVQSLKQTSKLPVFLFPGDFTQIAENADAILFLSLLSGRNPEYLVGQQVEAVSKLKSANLEIVATGYLLLDGGHDSAVARVTQTNPMKQDDIEKIIHTALAGQYMGAKLLYLEAGSGAKFPVFPKVISAVKKAISIPLIIGGGIRSEAQKDIAYNAGADMVVMGTVFEEKSE